MGEGKRLAPGTDDDRFAALVIRYLDGVCGEAEVRELELAIAGEAAWCERFVELCIHARSLAEPLRNVIGRPAARRGPARWRGVAIRMATAAAVVLAIIGGMSLMLSHDWNQARSRHTAAPVYATLLATRDAVFDDSDLPTDAGSPLSGGYLHLRSGEVDLEFASTARVTLRGPAVFGINSAMRGELEKGWLRCEVPPTAHGFTIAAPGLAVVDLGTRFSMDVRDRQTARVVVEKGRVKLQRDRQEVDLQSGQTANLVAGLLSLVTRRVLVDGQSNNGGFEEPFGTDPRRRYADAENWFNGAGSAQTYLTNGDLRHSGMRAGVVSRASWPTLSTGYRLHAGDVVSLRFWHTNNRARAASFRWRLIYYSDETPDRDTPHGPAGEHAVELTGGLVTTTGDGFHQTSSRSDPIEDPAAIGRTLYVQFFGGPGNNTDFPRIDDVSVAVESTAAGAAMAPASSILHRPDRASDKGDSK